VLLPGLDGTGELFAAFVDALAASIETQVIAYPEDRAMSYAEHLAFAQAQLPTDRDFVLLAESFSGPIGIAIAADAPRGLKGLILCVTFASNPLPLFGPLSRFFGALPALRVPPALSGPWLYGNRGTPKLKRAHARVMKRVAPSTLRARVAAILGVDHRSLLRRIEVPMIYMRANADRLIPKSASQAILALRSDIDLKECDAPHFLLQTEPHWSAGAVMTFIKQKVDGNPDQPEAPDGPLTAEQALRVSQLNQHDLQEMDRVLLAQASHIWRKVARIVGTAMGEHPSRVAGIPDLYYAQRVRHLVELGKLESQGDLAYMRFSEVRLPAKV
jgi:pimeloyl-ACP methyl ester carboxylesterase